MQSRPQWYRQTRMSGDVDVLREGWNAAVDSRAVRGDFETFAAHLGALCIEATTPSTAEELAFAWACGHGQPGALRAFEEHLMPAAQRAIGRVDPDPGFVDEAVQRLRTRLLLPRGDHPPRMLTFCGRGPLRGWVSVAAVRTALGMLREQQRQTQREEMLWSEAVLFPAGIGPDLRHLKDRYAPILAQSLRTACGQLDERERAVLRLYFAEGLNIDKIGAVYGVHRSTVARWIARTKATLVERMHALMREDRSIPTEELSSIDRLVRSQLEISLGGLLGP